MMRRFGAPASGGGGGDPYWSNVVSLLHFDGADGSTTFTDQTGKTWTAYGNAQIDTAQSKFGGASGAFASAGDYLSASSTAACGFGAGDYTIEAWVMLPSIGGNRAIFDTRSASNAGIAVYANAVSGGNGVSVANNAAEIIKGSVLTSNVFAHIALTRASGTLRLFVDGVLQGSVTDSRTLASSTAPFIGDNYLAPSQPLLGWIDELRVTKGVARYTASFTPPSAPFPDS